MSEQELLSRLQHILDRLAEQYYVLACDRIEDLIAAIEERGLEASMRRQPRVSGRER